MVELPWAEGLPAGACGGQEYHHGAQQSIFAMALTPQYDGVDVASVKQSLYKNHGAVLVGAVVDNEPVLVTSGVMLRTGDIVYILGHPEVRTLTVGRLGLSQCGGETTTSLAKHGETNHGSWIMSSQSQLTFFAACAAQG
jgi:hypothetical protein